MRVAIIVARAVDCCVGVALASGRAALWVRSTGEGRKLGYTCIAVEVEREGSIPQGVHLAEPPICLDRRGSARLPPQVDLSRTWMDGGY